VSPLFPFIQPDPKHTLMCARHRESEREIEEKNAGGRPSLPASPPTMVPATLDRLLPMTVIAQVSDELLSPAEFGLKPGGDGFLIVFDSSDDDHGIPLLPITTDCNLSLSPGFPSTAARRWC
jgi:hypothetical protein